MVLAYSMHGKDVKCVSNLVGKPEGRRAIGKNWA
jgi:hypothetical protein